MTTPATSSSVKLIEREDFLSAVEPRRVMLLRMRTETPGIHMLGLFTDLNEQYAILQEIGPQGVYGDIAAAAANAPTGLRLAYVIPCIECAPFSLPQNITKVKLPPTLAELKSPPKNFTEATPPPVTVDKKTGFAVTSTPARASQPPAKNGTHAAENKPTPAHAAAPAPAPTPAPAPKPEVKAPEPVVESAKPAPAETRQPTGALAALGLTLEKMQQATKSVESLQQRELELRRERAEFQESCAHRLLELESRELELTRRENELALRIATLNELLLQIDSLRRANFGTDADA